MKSETDKPKMTLQEQVTMLRVSVAELTNEILWIKRFTFALLALNGVKLFF